MPEKAWMRERWAVLIPQLEALTVDDQEEIKRICDEEKAYWRTRMDKPSALKDPMRFARNRIKQIQPLTDQNSFVDPRDEVRKHIALKYMNFTAEEVEEVNRPSAALVAARMEDQQTIDDPDAVCAKAAELLKSPYWPDRVAALAVTTGRRLGEILHPKSRLSSQTLYSVTFEGQLKRKDKTLLPYEIPTNVLATLVLEAWEGVRSELNRSEDEAMLSTRYGPQVKEAAMQHFSGLIPPRSGGDLYTHLFRACYGCIAVFFYCPERVHELRYESTIYGHYWKLANGEVEYDTAATLHYTDYQVSAAAVMRAGGYRKGTHLDLPGVKVLEVFKEKPAILSQKGKKEETPLLTKTPSKTGNSPVTVKETTKAIFDQIAAKLGLKANAAMLRICEDFYRLEQITGLLTPYYEQLDVDPQQARENAPVETFLALVNLLEQVAQAAEGKVDEAKKPYTAVGYLHALLAAKAKAASGYERRTANKATKDYTKMSLTYLRESRQPGAARERYRRAAEAVMKYNEEAPAPEMRWFINAKALLDLVGGRPAAASDYVDEHATDLKAHHDHYHLSAGVNRKPVAIKDRVLIPEWPEGVNPSSQETPEEETREE
jgi:hypothetical protein